MDQTGPEQRARDQRLRAAIIYKGASSSRLDELVSQGARAGRDVLIIAAEHGDAAGLAWALARFPKWAPGEPPAHLVALWRSMELSASNLKKVEALSEALGLPRALADQERPLASRALCAAASAGGAGFGALLDVVEPLVSAEGDERLQVWNAATLGGGEALRRLKSHPAHGALMTPERQSEALRFALGSKWMGEGLALEAVKELFHAADLGEPDGEGSWEAPLALAAARGWASAARWMLDHGEGRISVAMGKAAERAALENGFKSESFGGALSGWIRAQEEREALEAEAPERSSESGAKRAEGKRPRV